jgi:hypothetical protein
MLNTHKLTTGFDSKKFNNQLGMVTYNEDCLRKGKKNSNPP